MEGEEQSSPKTFEELFDSILPTAVRLGIGIREFWEYTLAELTIIIEQHNERLQDEHRLHLEYDYNEAKLIATFVGLSMAGKDIPDIKELYPDLYSTGDAETDEQKELDYQLAMFTALANSINRERAKQ